MALTGGPYGQKGIDDSLEVRRQTVHRAKAKSKVPQTRAIPAATILPSPWMATPRA